MGGIFDMNENVTVYEVAAQEDSVIALKKSNNLTMIFAIIGVSLAVLYPIYSLLTTAIAAVPLPIIGLVVSAFLTVVEIVIALGALTCSIIALVRAIMFMGKRSSVEQTAETDKLFKRNIAWLCMGAGGIVIFLIGFFAVGLLNIIEFILSFI